MASQGFPSKLGIGSPSLQSLLKSMKDSVLSKAETDGVALRLARDSLDARSLARERPVLDIAAGLSGIASGRSSATPTKIRNRSIPSPSKRPQITGAPIWVPAGVVESVNALAKHMGAISQSKIKTTASNSQRRSSRSSKRSHPDVRVLAPSSPIKEPGHITSIVPIFNLGLHGGSMDLSILPRNFHPMRRPATAPPAPERKHTPTWRLHRTGEHTGSHFNDGHLTEWHQDEGRGAQRWEQAGGAMGCFEQGVRQVIAASGKLAGKRVVVSGKSGGMMSRPTMGVPQFNADGTINLKHPTAIYRVGGRIGTYSEVEYGRPSDLWIAKDSCPGDWPDQYIYARLKRPDSKYGKVPGHHQS